MKDNIVAAVQMNSGEDKDSNIKMAQRLIRIAWEKGAKMVVLPELFNWRGEPEKEKKYSETIPGKTTKAMARIAASLNIYLVAGSITETIAGNKKTYNSSVLFGPEGDILAVYRKLHLFDASQLVGGFNVMESETKKKGQEIVTASTLMGKIGLTICYDLRFPELYRRLTKKGINIAVAPSAFTFNSGKAHWETLVRARAIENQIYLIASNQYGKNPLGYEDFGNSLIIDPWGKILAGIEKGDGVITAKINLRYQELLRKSFPVLQHIREDIAGTE